MKIPHRVVGRTRPTAQPLGYLKDASTPQAFGVGVAEAIGGLGVAVNEVADFVNERNEKTQRFKDLRGLSAFNIDYNERFAELKRNTLPGSTDFPDRAISLYDEMANEFVSGVSPQHQEEFRLRLDQRKQSVAADSLRFSYEQQDAFAKTEIERAANEAKLGVASNPASLPEWERTIAEQLDATGLSEIEKEELAKKHKGALTAIVYQKEYERAISTPRELDGVVGVNGQPVTPDMGTMEIASAFLGAHEETNNKVIANFIEKTTGKKLNPAQIAWCADFVNAVLGAQGADGTGKANARSFLDYGTAVNEPSEGDIVVLWRESPTSWKGHVGFFKGFTEDGKVQILGGNQSHKVSVASYDKSRVLGFRRPPVAGTQPAPQGPGPLELQRMSEVAAAELDADPRFNSIPYEDRLSMQEAATTKVKKEQSAQEAVEKEVYDSATNSLLISLRDGVAGQPAIDAWRESFPGFKYSDLDRAQDLLDGMNEQVDLRASAAAKIQSGGIWDPTSSDDKEMLNALVGDEGLGRLQQMDRNFVTDGVIPLTRHTGDIPTSVSGMLQGMMRSNNVEQATFALDMMSQLQAADPRAFDQRFPSDVISDVEFYQARKHITPQEELLKSVNKGFTPEERRGREQLAERAKTELAEIDVQSVAVEHFDTWLGSTPTVNSLGWAAQGLSADFQAAFVDEYVKYGNKEEATTAALKRMSRVWGVTGVGGRPVQIGDTWKFQGGNVLMRYPPEKAGYKEVDGSYDWINRQVREELGLTSDDEFQLISDDKTREEMLAHQQNPEAPPPSYLIATKDSMGVWSVPVDEGGRLRMNFEMDPQVQAEAEEADIRRNDLIRFRGFQGDYHRAMNHSRRTGIPIPQEMEEEMEMWRERLDLPEAIPPKTEPELEPLRERRDKAVSEAQNMLGNIREEDRAAAQRLLDNAVRPR